MKKMTKTLLTVGALGAAAYGLYEYVIKPRLPLSAVPAGENTQYTLTATQGGQTVSMKVGDLLAGPGVSGTAGTTGGSVFGGQEAAIANGSAQAVAKGTETINWTDGTSVTVTVS